MCLSLICMIWPFVKGTSSTYSMLLEKKIFFCNIYKSSVSTGFAEQIISILRISCYNGGLVTWTVLSLTTAKFKPLVFSLCGFALSYSANIFILINFVRAFKTAGPSLYNYGTENAVSNNASNCCNGRLPSNGCLSWVLFRFSTIMSQHVKFLIINILLPPLQIPTSLTLYLLHCFFSYHSFSFFTFNHIDSYFLSSLFIVFILLSWYLFLNRCSCPKSGCFQTFIP
jgi:hypothetical protein